MLELICKKLGVVFGEEWLANDGYIHRINRNGTIEWYYEDTDTWNILRSYENVLNGRLKPMRKTKKWRPKNGDVYYIPYLIGNESDRYNPITYWGDTQDDWYLSNNLLFKTKEEAIETTNKILEVLKEGVVC